MVEKLPDVPPALLLLLHELHRCESWQGMRKRVKEMLRDLRDQSEVFEVEQIARESDSRGSSRFEVHLHGAMDLLSERGCSDLDCRVATADRIARSIGLIGDRVWLTDRLSERFTDFGRPTNARLDAVVADFLVLSRLLPLILAGVVRFRSPWVPTCGSCLDIFEAHVERTAKQLCKIFRAEFHVERHPDWGFVVDTGKCLEPNMRFHSTVKSQKRLPTPHKIASQWVYEELRSTFWTAREAAMTGGAVFSNSRVGIAGLAKQDGRLVDMPTLLLMDKSRELSVPWVSDLNASQIVQLRQEAAEALPLFREMLSRAITVRDQGEAGFSGDPSSFVSDLREQAIQVRAELEAKRSHSARYWKATYAVLGLGMSAYGVATDQVLAGVGGILPVIQLLIDHKAGHESDVSKVIRKPGYVLVKAQDILAHSHRARD